MPGEGEKGEEGSFNREKPGLVLGDFAWRDGRIFLRKTGNSAKLDRILVAEIAIWLVFYMIVRARALVGNLRRTRGTAILFEPDIPHGRYLVRTAAIWAGIRLARSPADADACFFFEDSTRSVPRRPALARHFNFGCTDISKSRVAAVFESVFGYPLAIDPRGWTGEAVEKSEENGVHDGRIVRCPLEPVAGKAYQRLVDTVASDGRARDLRTHVVGGVPIAVWVKQRDPVARFLPPNLAVTRHSPEEIFDPSEIARIGRFAEAMGADWCGLDILRDQPSGLIYIVDVNKTDAGPIIALSLREKLASTALLARALQAMIEDPRRPDAR
jgi:hypothetical protein